LPIGATGAATAPDIAVRANPVAASAAIRNFCIKNPPPRTFDLQQIAHEVERAILVLVSKTGRHLPMGVADLTSAARNAVTRIGTSAFDSLL
jgi:hypothetical protein